MNIYRKIWETHFGAIPKDEFGRTYEIHHIDGNHNNNNINNLKCVSIQEHYDIHYSQGDWYACYLIAQRSNLSPDIISENSKKTQKQRIENGTHNFLNPKTYICPHCKKSGKGGIMFRYHFDKCKLRNRFDS